MMQLLEHTALKDYTALAKLNEVIATALSNAVISGQILCPEITAELAPSAVECDAKLVPQLKQRLRKTGLLPSDSYNS